MRFVDSLQHKWADRGSREKDWFKRNYEQAVGRVEDHSDDVISGDPNPHWFSPKNEASACPQGSLTDKPVVIDEFGNEYSPDDARKQAFELLVLADLAEISGNT